MSDQAAAAVVEDSSDAPTSLFVDPAAASAAADPLPGAKKGRPFGSKNRPRTEAQVAASKASGAQAAARAAAARKAKAGPTDAQLRDAVATVYAMTGAGVAFIDQELGQTVAACSDQAAAAWLHLAQQNPTVRRVLVQLTTASASGELLMAHAPLLALVVARTQGRRAPADIPPYVGDVPPDWNGAGPPPTWTPPTGVPMS